jgi:hypothetical protein
VHLCVRCAEFTEAYHRLTRDAAVEAQEQLVAYERAERRMREIEAAADAKAYEAQRKREARGWLAASVAGCC